jgi:phytoene synthase
VRLVAFTAVRLAYRHCENLTRRRARNFYYGIRLLPEQKRLAMCALYAMARRVDDIGDDFEAQRAGVKQELGEDRRLAALEAVRASITLLARAATAAEPAKAAVAAGDPVLMALADTHARFNLPLTALEELLEGCAWDISGRRYETFDELVEYCRRVAGTIGRLSLAIYGATDYERAEPLADALGVALQLTNVLRDLVEDREMGRVYLPREDLERFGVGPSLEGEPENLMALVCFESGRAAEWYEQGFGLLELLDRRSAACTAAMAGIYRRLLDKIRSDPLSVLTERISLSPVEKVAVAAVALARRAA